MSALPLLIELVARLRGPDGCPWDRAQDLATLRPYLLEECHELLEAMDRAALGQVEAPGALREELGDLLFMVVLLARVAEERGWFTLEDAARGIHDKMVRRHPHVFGQGEEGAAGSIAAWEARKARDADGQPRSRLAGVPRSLPALLRSHRQGEKAAAVGFDWPDTAGVLAKVEEELAELREAMAAHPAPRDPRQAETGMPAAHPRVEHELGDLLMAVASLGRHLGAPPESALQRANDRFQARFQAMERGAWARGEELAGRPAEELEALWQAVKADDPA